MEEENNVLNKKFVIRFILFMLLLILVTITAIYFTFLYIDNENTKILDRYEEEKSNKNYYEEKKIQAEDKKYAIKAYNETYNENSIVIKDVDDYNINYIEIDGLKNVKIQNQINERIKNMAYGFKTRNVSTYASANFSNILSIVFLGEFETKTLNIDLTTGNDIPLEKVFVSSAPLNLYIVNGFYKNLAWDVDFDYESNLGLQNSFDMDRRDTSEYEDKFLMLIREFEKKKNDIVYSIAPEGVTIYKLANKLLNNEYSLLEIEFVDCIDEVAIYKRYLTDESIFKNDKLGQKDIIVCTDNALFGKDAQGFYKLSYGKLTDNIFTEEIVESYEEEYENKVVKDFIVDLSNKNKSEFKKSLGKTQGAILQSKYYVYTREEEEYYTILEHRALAISSIEYFEEYIFRDYIKMKNLPRFDGINIFDSYDFENNDKVRVENKSNQYFIRFNGEFLGNTEEEVKAKLEGEIDGRTGRADN